MPLTSVPARLVYACGHAALVSLPVVKGETPRQRTERVQREKEAAQQRSCDFCAPVAVHTALPIVEELVTNGEVQVQPEAPAVIAPAPETPATEEQEESAEPLPEEPAPVQAEEEARPVPRRRTRVTRAAQRSRFRITFVAEQVIQAKTVLDALAQAQARGASDVVSIVRLD